MPSRSSSHSPPRARPMRPDRILTWALVAVLAWAPLPLGSDRPWAWGLLGLSTALLLMASGLGQLARPASRIDLSQLRWPLILGGLLAAWALFQTAPWDLFGWHHPLWDQAAEALGQAVRPSISVAPEASLARLFRLLTYAGLFLVAWRTGHQGENAALIVRAVALLGTVHAAYGLVEFSSRDPSILWLPKLYYRHDVTSTFVNRNSYATFAGLSVLANLALIAEALMKNVDSRSRATTVLSMFENLLWRAKFPVIGTIVTSAGLLLSHSRGGLVATAAGIAALVASVAAAPSLSAPWCKWFAGVVIAAGGGALLLSGGGVFERLNAMSDVDEGRGAIYDATLAAIRDNLLTGTGLGSFQFVFPMYQPASLAGLVDLAHDDYLENILELGLPAALLLYALLAYLIGQCALGIRRRRRDALYPCIAVAASTLAGVHSIFDFSLQIPAVAATYAALLGIGVAQSASSKRASGSS